MVVSFDFVVWFELMPAVLVVDLLLLRHSPVCWFVVVCLYLLNLYFTLNLMWLLFDGFLILAVVKLVF